MNSNDRSFFLTPFKSSRLYCTRNIHCKISVIDKNHIYINHRLSHQLRIFSFLWIFFFSFFFFFSSMNFVRRGASLASKFPGEKGNWRYSMFLDGSSNARNLFLANFSTTFEFPWTWYPRRQTSLFDHVNLVTLCHEFNRPTRFSSALCGYRISSGILCILRLSRRRFNV